MQRLSAKNIFRVFVSTLLAFAVVALFHRVLHVNTATVALTFLGLIVFIATRWRLAYAVYLSLLCPILYNFYFLPPIGKFTIADPQNWITFCVFLGTGFLVSHLAESERRQRETSERRRDEVEHLYEFSQRLLLHDDLRGLARATPSIVAAVFGLRAVALYVKDHGEIYYADPANVLPSVMTLKIAVQGERSSFRVNGASVIPLMMGLQYAGALIVFDENASERVYEAIGSLVAIALERAAALERSSHIEAVREGERLRNALLDSVTHELRTPLTAIRAAATSLLGPPELPPMERREMYAVVDEESVRLDRLIGEAVEMAQLDASGLQVRPQMLSVRELIESLLQQERAHFQARPIELQLADDLPEVPMDRDLVSRVLRHLIENAIRYSTPRSVVRISAEVADRRLQVSVANEGAGIDPVEQPYIFDKFFRGSNRGSVEGSGMGLAIAKAILVAHGGGIAVKSESGKGAIFTFWLPLQNIVL